jgi:hypothetical protein
MHDIIVNMEARNWPQTLEAFTGLIPGGEALRPAKAQLPLPAWVKSAANLRSMHGPQGMLLVFVEPKEALPFEQISGLVRLIRKESGAIPVIVADHVNPRYRSLFAREHIAYIYSGGYVIPELGLKVFGRIGQGEPVARNLQEELSPLSLKILGGYLTDQLGEDALKVDTLTNKLQKLGQEISTSKVSRTLRELVEIGYAQEQGRGPAKTFALKPKAELWYQLQRAPTARLFRATAGPMVPKAKERVWAADSALAELTNLAPANPRTFAVHTRADGTVAVEAKAIPDDWGQEVVIQFWKEDPKLFAVEGCLNPIEVYFSLRTHPDDRVQIALQEMLERYGLKMRNE